MMEVGGISPVSDDTESQHLRPIEPEPALAKSRESVAGVNIEKSRGVSGVLKPQALVLQHPGPGHYRIVFDQA